MICDGVNITSYDMNEALLNLKDKYTDVIKKDNEYYIKTGIQSLIEDCGKTPAAVVAIEYEDGTTHAYFIYDNVVGSVKHILDDMSVKRGKGRVKGFVSLSDGEYEVRSVI